MARVETIVVGGGVNATSPFTVNRIPYIINTDPPFLAASPIMTQVTGANQAIIISPTAADPQAASTTLLRVVGGIASFFGTTANLLGTLVIGARQSIINSGGKTGWTIIGNDAVVDTVGSDTTAVGRAFTQVSGGGGVITALGAAISIGSGIPDTIIAIGNAITVGNMNGGNSGRLILIGAGITVTGGVVQIPDVVLIGSGSTHGAGGGSNSVVGVICSLSTAVRACGVGRNNTWSAAVEDTGVLGVNNAIQHSSCILLGSGITTHAVSQCYIGGTTVGSAGIVGVVIGKGNLSGAPSAVTIRLTDGTGVDIAGGSLTVQPGAGTGAAAASSILFKTPTVGASGAGAQAMATRLTVATAAITATVPIIHPAGAVGAPSIQFTDADTGLFEQAAGNVAVTLNGVESARFSGGGAGEVNLMLYDVTAATLQRVSIGANDSGGAGFRVLRIPN